MAPTTIQPPDVTWDEVCPELDAALAGLNDQHRSIVALHFMEGKSFREVGQAMGTSEDAARLAAARAIKKLRRRLGPGNTLVSATVLSAMLGAHGAEAAPASLLPAIELGVAHAAVGGTVASIASTLAKEAFIAMQIAKAKTVVVGILLGLLALAVPVAVVTVKKFPDFQIRSSPLNPGTPGTVAMQATLPDGGNVELLGVSDGQRWWSPDGSPLSRALSEADFSSLKDPYGETRATYQFAIRLTGLANNPESIYLQISGGPRTAPTVRLRQSLIDPSLFYGAALLYPEQVETSWARVAYSTLPWNKITLDGSGRPQPPLPTNLPPDQQYLSHLFPVFPFSRVHEKDGKSILNLGMEIWGVLEYTAVAIARDGSSHPASNLLTGLVTGGDNWNWAFDLPPTDIERFEISVRDLDQFASFVNLSLQPGHKTRPEPERPSGSRGRSYFDDAFYNQLFSRDLGENLRAENISAATAAAAELIAQLKTRRARLQAGNNPNLYLADKALPIVTLIHAALERNDLAAATALLQADTVTGRCLQNALQKLAQIR